MKTAKASKEKSEMYIATTYDPNDPRLDFIPNRVFRKLAERSAKDLDHHFDIWCQYDREAKTFKKFGKARNQGRIATCSFIYDNIKYSITEKYKVSKGKVMIGYVVYKHSC